VRTRWLHATFWQNQIALDVWKAYQTLLTNSQSFMAASDLVASAELSERMTLGRYKPEWRTCPYWMC